MSIEKLDKNFIVKTDISEPDIVWLDAKEAPFRLHGVSHNGECYIRIPVEVAEAVSENVAGLNYNTAGGRVRFRTNSSYIAINCVTENTFSMPHIPLTGQSGYDIYYKTDRMSRPEYLNTFIPPTGTKKGYSSSLRTSGEMAEYTINLPLYDNVKELYIALKKDAEIYPAQDYLYTTPVVYYGSSITQGGCASRPGNSYQSIISRHLDTDYINLGFSGSALGEEAMCRYLASLDMSVFVCDYDHNAPTPEHLEKTLYPLYETVRKAQPDTPVIFISAPNVKWNRDFYGPRREVVYSAFKKAVANGDKNVYYIDGEELFGNDDWDSCAVDALHPNDLGFYRMAMRIEKTLKPILR